VRGQPDTARLRHAHFIIDGIGMSHRRPIEMRSVSVQNLALIFGSIAVLALCLYDSHIDPTLYRVGKWGLAISGTLFVVTEAIALMST
jgi:hypothetical protein